uniref:RNase H type-1 domain-containing protein n=1 Tax=Cajanus cajan TaxID=3821 RepID=A0A151TRH1_CAJCA|nr:hypothetical protein KK1_008872 [Cajanus cajan]
MGSCSVIQSKLWAIFLGLQLIVDRQLGMQVILESDSLKAINLLKDGCVRNHPCADMI